MRNYSLAIVTAVSLSLLFQVARAGAEEAVALRPAPAAAGILASVRIEFRSPHRVNLSIAPGHSAGSTSAELEEAVADWSESAGQLLVTYDAAADRLTATVENDSGSPTIALENAVSRGIVELDPLRFAPSVMGLVAEAANRGDAGAIELVRTEVRSDGHRPRRLQEIGAGAQAVSQLLHAEHALAHGFSLAGTIRLTGARPSPTSPLVVEILLLAGPTAPREDELRPGTPESSDDVFTNSTPTTIPNLGTANPYPSLITVGPGYLSGVIKSIVVGIDNLDHTYPDEIAALLVGPSGANVELMRRACGSFDLLDVDLTFDDAAILSLPDAAPCFSGSFKPTQFGSFFNFPAPAPGALYGMVLADFLGQTPIGTWSLYLYTPTDYDFPDFGIIDGWSLTLTTEIRIPFSGNVGNAAPYPSTYTLTGFDPGLSAKGCGVFLEDLSHSYLGDLQLLLVSPSGQTSHLVGNACGNTNAVDLDWTLGDDPLVGFLPGSSCVSGVYRPTVVGAQAFPPPAPAGPYGRALAGVSGSGMNGVWSLYALDDSNGDVGRLRDWSFACSTAQGWIFADGFETADMLLWTSDAP